MNLHGNIFYCIMAGCEPSNSGFDDNDFTNWAKKAVRHGWNTFFVAVSRTSLAGLQPTVNTLLFANHKTKVLKPVQSLPTHTWAVANEEKISKENKLSEYRMGLQLGSPIRMKYLVKTTESRNQWKSNEIFRSSVRLLFYLTRDF